jgi:hypothetical protein
MLNVIDLVGSQIRYLIAETVRNTLDRIIWVNLNLTCLERQSLRTTG